MCETKTKVEQIINLLTNMHNQLATIVAFQNSLEVATGNIATRKPEDVKTSLKKSAVHPENQKAQPFFTGDLVFNEVRGTVHAVRDCYKDGVGRWVIKIFDNHATYDAMLFSLYLRRA